MIYRDSSLPDIKSVIQSCISLLYSESERELFERNNGKGLCERAIVFRFAYYLQKTIENFYVDCDFNSSYPENGNNRSQPQPGKPIRNENGTKTGRFVDIIIHKRGNFENNEPNTSNFLCLEIKKWNNHNKKQIEKDKNNLKALTTTYGYRYGFYLSIHKIKKKTKWTIYKDGRIEENESGVFDNEQTN